MFIKKKKHHEMLDELRGRLDSARQDAVDARQNAAQWRMTAERLQMTPEIKADTESAHKRGESMARNKMQAYLSSEFARISADLAKSLSPSDSASE